MPGAGGATVDAGETALFFYDTVGETLIDAGRYSHTAAVTPGAFLIRGFSGSDNTLYFDDLTHKDVLTVVPEPAALTLVGIGVLVTGFTRRKRRR